MSRHIRIARDDPQSRVHSQRTTVANEKRETEGLIESFENIDPRRRAGRRENR